MSAATDFPGLRAETARFDGPGGTLVHRAVCRAIADYLGGAEVANDHGAFAASRRSTEIVAWARDRVRALLGAPGGHVLFGLNMTTLTSNFMRAAENDIGPADEIVCTELDHEANVRPWLAMAARRGARVRIARMVDGALPVESVAAVLSERTRWVAVTGASNALGVVPDVPAISALAHAAGARVYVDGVQLVPHRPVNVAALGADAFVTSAYKWYGPHCGALWLADAGGFTLAEQVASAGSDLPDRLELGTTSFEAVLGTGVAAEVLLGWDREAVAEREQKLAGQLLAELRTDPRIRVLGPAADADAVPVVTFQVVGVPAATVASRLAEAGVAVWDGVFYAGPAMLAVAPGDPDAVRAGIAAYTTEDDVARLLSALDRAARPTGGTTWI